MTYLSRESLDKIRCAHILFHMTHGAEVEHPLGDRETQVYAPQWSTYPAVKPARWFRRYDPIAVIAWCVVVPLSAASMVAVIAVAAGWRP